MPLRTPSTIATEFELLLKEDYGEGEDARYREIGCVARSFGETVTVLTIRERCGSWTELCGTASKLLR
jgi:hypothetical protein